MAVGPEPATVTTAPAGVGIARYVRSADDPHAADIAVTVIDDWQRRGFGSALLTQLTGDEEPARGKIPI